MKKVISVLLTITMLLGITVSVPLSASAVTTDKVVSGDTYTNEYGNWEYRLTDDSTGCIITGYNRSHSNIEIPSAINNIPVVEIGDYAFYNCYSVTYIKIPDSVTTIGVSAFANCSSLVSVIISDSVTYINSGAFRECVYLNNVVIPNSVTNIDYDAFYNCSNLSDIYYTGTSSEWYDISINWGNDYLTNATINYNTHIENNEYGTWVCSPNYYNKGYKITGCFGCKNDLEIPGVINNIPVVEIADYAFSFSRELISVTIPNNVTTIGDRAFEMCESLISVSMADSVVTMGEFAFVGCRKLTNVKLSNSLTAISYSAFTGSGLTSITIPEKVNLIDYNAFSCCYRLTSVTFLGSVSFIANYAFSDCYNLTNVIIPDSDYYLGIGDNAFSECSSLSSIRLPNGTYYIAPGAFSECSNLSSIIIPNSVGQIHSNAFEACINLTDVYYTGSKKEWNNISIEKYKNDNLLNATIHYNYGKQITGDISGDGDLAVNDVIYLLKNIVDAQELTDEQIALADVSGDGKLTVLDAILIQKLVLEAE